MSFSFLTIILQLVFLECILSIDNAAIMGAMVAHLPNDQMTPWPARLQPILHRFDHMLGPQREAALKVGLFGAYAGRIIMLILATVIIERPWVQILGALYLLYLAFSHFVTGYQSSRQDAQQQQAKLRTQGFWNVVIALNLADMAFSLDNVVAAVALSKALWIVIIGVGIGILLIRFGATLFTQLMEWEPALEHAAYLLLVAIGSEILIEQWLHIDISDWTKFSISLAILALTVIGARARAAYIARSTDKVKHHVQ